MRVFHIARKEILQTFRDRRMLAILFIAPIMQLIIFGYAATYDINFIPTAVLDYSKSQKSRELITTIQASGYFHVLYTADRSDEITKLVTLGDVWCGIVIPERYEEYIKAGKSANVQVIFDGTNSNTAGIIASYLARIVQQYSEELMSTTIRPVSVSDTGLNTSLMRPRVDARTRAWYNPDLSSHTYNIPAVLVMIMLVITMVLTSMAVVKEKELGTIEQISVTPIRPIELMMGKTMPFVVIGVVDILVVTAVAIFWFKVPFMGSIWFLLLCSFTFMLTTLGTGLLISTFSSTQQQAMMTTFLFIMPFTILSGFAYPISNMPESIQYITYINPVRYFVTIARAIFLKGSGYAELKFQLFALLIIGLSVMAFSVFRFRKRVS